MNNNSTEGQQAKKTKTASAMSDMLDRVNQLVRSKNRAALAQECTTRDASASGTKFELALRIVQADDPLAFASWKATVPETCRPFAVRNMTPDIVYTPRPVTILSCEMRKQLRIDDDPKTLLWRCDPFGLVFYDSQVIGRLTEAGELEALLPENVDQCRCYKFPMHPHCWTTVLEQTDGREPWQNVGAQQDEDEDEEDQDT